MTAVQILPAEARGSLGNTFLTTKNRNVCALFYDDTARSIPYPGLATYISTTSINTGTDTFSRSSRHVTLLRAGMYLVYAHVTATISSGSGVTSVVMFLQVDQTGTGSSYAEVAATKTFFNTTTTEQTSGECSSILYIKAGGLLRVVYSKDTNVGNTVTTLVQGTRLGITSLYEVGSP